MRSQTVFVPVQRYRSISFPSLVFFVGWFTVLLRYFSFLFSPFLHCYSRFESAKQFGLINRACDRTTSENTENKPQVAWLRFQRDIAPLCIFPPFRQPNALGYFLVSPLNSRLGLINKHKRYTK